MPCPALGSQLCGILGHSITPFTQELRSLHSCQGTWLGTATYCCTMFGVFKQESDVFAQRPKGTTPPELGERRCKSQRMPWHGPCPVPSSILKTKATRDAQSVSRDEEKESSEISPRITSFMVHL